MYDLQAQIVEPLDRPGCLARRGKGHEGSLPHTFGFFYAACLLEMRAHGRHSDVLAQTFDHHCALFEHFLCVLVLSVVARLVRYSQ